ncbi:hypothetical protein D7X33_25535 [Butyricicoccus sp. 1XD8-22]|nr:hypothetical protein D7X33_25535 [Butyricicoccus sp. 1XD8-22]
MWQSRECSNCQNEVFVQHNEVEVDVFCDKCEEIVELRVKIQRYERALLECVNRRGLLNFLEENDWATSDDYFVKIAKEALNS